MSAARAIGNSSILNDSSATEVRLTFDPDPDPHHCGYCNTNGNCSIGFVASRMLVDDYQALMDRGWRKCGSYFYKSLMRATCCPLYTIRCDVNNLRVSSSQRRAIQMMNRYINYDIKPGVHGASNNVSLGSTTTEKSLPSDSKKCEENKSTKTITVDQWLNEEPATHARQVLRHVLTTDSGLNHDLEKKLKARQKKWYKKLCRVKAKQPFNGETDIHRLIKRADRLSLTSAQCSLEEMLKLNDTTKNKFELRLVRSYPPSEEYKQTLRDSHQVYQRYQMAIHHDDESDCCFSQFERFLGKSTLYGRVPGAEPSSTPACGYGSFHLQYYLNKKIVACSVIDILPGGVSSVYFFYEPDLAFLNLGVYSALREIELTRRLAKEVPDIRHYYLGFYIHSCVKMRYKGQYSPSFLLCPETYTWHPIERCRPLLDANKYVRFESDLTKGDREEEKNLENIKLKVHQSIITPLDLRRLDQKFYSYFLARLVMFAKFVGRSCANRLIIVLN